MRAAAARRRAAGLPLSAGEPGASRPADNSLALPRPPGIACGQRGKGGGPTACIAVGLARWLSASRRPAGAPAAASARRCDHWPSLARPLGVAGVPQGGGRRIHGRHRAPGLAGLVQPVPVWPASHHAEQDERAPARRARAAADARHPARREAPGGLYFPAAFPEFPGIAWQFPPRIPWRPPTASEVPEGAQPGLRPRRCA
jgi:hypothetical protein